MKHPREEELIAYHSGEEADRASVAGHVADCPECRAELERIDAVLEAITSIAVPDPGEGYGQRVWQQIAPQLPEKRGRWWRSFFGGLAWLTPQRLVAAGAIAALIIAAFLAGRATKHDGTGEVAVAVDQGKVRERVLIMAVGEHLGRSEMVLVELANAEPQGAGKKGLNISEEQRRAEDLLEENRLYRQTALEQGDTALAGVLDELERTLLDVAHSPQKPTAAQLEGMRQRIENRGILFKVRVVGKELQQRGESGQTPAAPAGAKEKGRKI